MTRPEPMGKAVTIEQSGAPARHAAPRARLSAAAILSEAAEPARPPSRARCLAPRPRGAPLPHLPPFPLPPGAAASRRYL